MPDDDPTPDPKKDDPKPDPDAGAKKALDDERKARRDAEKVANDLRAKLKEFEDKDKSDGEKLSEKITAAEKRASDAEARAMRLEVAAAKGLTPAQAKRLVGATQEELEADADEILEAFPTKDGATPPPSRKPSTDLKGGTDPTEDAVETDPAKLAELVPRL